ncbi:SRPBCC family protein [Pseudohalocynthiibacter aestuariivivens]|jgi:hypothetical protein|uniref:SRPBCC family protein n=1 Tax=Pseudohalocynthiibacter aestuariivivens TaxID=1591409 RepID=A0ABV5JI33_9RHOB|nr:MULTISPECIES: SRPBCC family protein [Pseudohalocynthiibacter]MBS9717418.1 SRPBCC family protein [Pseudohalocynthiibacter aestuariivivens]MCK0102248.1 SRPBCC family protein [Pseudohalocynthiibacter sp. F2068]
MKFSTREDIEAPIEHVFQAISDFDGFERSALRRGAEVQRRERLTEPGAEKGWDIGFEFRGKPRRIVAELTHFDAPNGLQVATATPGIAGDLVAELVPLSRSRTRLRFSLEMRPTSLGGRLTIQSLKLAKGNLTRRFVARVAKFAIDVEDRYKKY